MSPSPGWSLQLLRSLATVLWLVSWSFTLDMPGLVFSQRLSGISLQSSGVLLLVTPSSQGPSRQMPTVSASPLCLLHVDCHLLSGFYLQGLESGTGQTVTAVTRWALSGFYLSRILHSLLSNAWKSWSHVFSSWLVVYSRRENLPLTAVLDFTCSLLIEDCPMLCQLRKSGVNVYLQDNHGFSEIKMLDGLWLEVKDHSYLLSHHQKPGIFRDSFKIENRMLVLYPNHPLWPAAPSLRPERLYLGTMSFCPMDYRSRDIRHENLETS